MKSITNPSANQIKELETMLYSIVKKHALNPDIDLPIRLQIAQEMTATIQVKIPGNLFPVGNPAGIPRNLR